MAVAGYVEMVGIDASGKFQRFHGGKGWQSKQPRWKEVRITLRAPRGVKPWVKIKWP